MTQQDSIFSYVFRKFDEAEGKITEALTLAEKINGELNSSFWLQVIECKELENFLYNTILVFLQVTSIHGWVSFWHVLQTYMLEEREELVTTLFQR